MGKYDRSAPTWRVGDHINGRKIVAENRAPSGTRRPIVSCNNGHECIVATGDAPLSCGKCRVKKWAVGDAIGEMLIIGVVGHDALLKCPNGHTKRVRPCDFPGRCVNCKGFEWKVGERLGGRIIVGTTTQPNGAAFPIVECKNGHRATVRRKDSYCARCGRFETAKIGGIEIPIIDIMRALGVTRRRVRRGLTAQLTPKQLLLSLLSRGQRLAVNRAWAMTK